MQTGIKIVDKESKHINWKRLDELSDKAYKVCKFVFITGATVYGLLWLFKGLCLWLGV